MPTDNNLLNTVLGQFTTAIQTTWYPLLQLYGIRILLMLAVLQFGIVGLQAVMTRNATSLIDDLAIGLIRIAVCWVVFENAATWGQALIDTGTFVGQAISTPRAVRNA